MEKSCLTCEFGGLTKKGKYSCSTRKYDYNHDCGKQCNCKNYNPKQIKMSKETAIINHRHMWNWLADNPKAQKSHYMVAHNIKPRPFEDCFLCEFVVENGIRNCNNCLLVWPPNVWTTNVCHSGGLWAR